MQLITTADGSHSIYVPHLDEHYHSTFGAIQESQHVFIQTGFQNLPIDLKEIHILEIGLGTGLNAFLTFLENEKNELTPSKPIFYTGVEAYPLAEDFFKKMNYVTALHALEHQAIFEKIHLSAWEQPIVIHPNFTLTKIHTFLEHWQPPTATFDLIYFDAFAPEVQPELWTATIFEKMYAALKPNGILTTYCVKGIVKRAMKSVDFSIQKLPGPPGKREILRGVKKV